MRAKIIHPVIRHTTYLLSVVAISILSSLVFISQVQAQTAPFLTTPYFGQKSVNSRFDHELPDYGVDDSLMGFNGIRLGPPASATNCTNGINGSCYNGHDGYDFGMSYEPVLAAAAGTVTQAQWHVIGVRQGTNALLGLYIEIDHGNNYRTRYGHLSAIAVSVGKTVQAGQIIGSTGATGNTGSPPGPHLHFTLLSLVNGTWRSVDPFGWTGGTDPWQQQNGAVSLCLWKDGEWANYCGGMRRPIPAPVNGGETQIDDNETNSNGFSKGSGGYPNNACTGNCGNWVRDSNMYYGNTNSIIENKWARWQPTIPSGGVVYEVFVFVPNVAANTTTWQAPYKIVHADGITTTIIDQEGSRNRWISIGSYRMLPSQNPPHGVYVSDATGEASGTRRVGVDSVKFIRRGTTYAPDTRTNDANNWNSYVTIRNNGGGEAKLLIQYLQADGTAACSTLKTNLAAHAVIAGTTCASANWASVVADSTQDVSVIVRQERFTTYTHEVYPGIDNPTAEVFVPLVHRNHSDWSSELFIQNAGTVDTNVNLQFFGIGGACVLTPCSGSVSTPVVRGGGRVRVTLTSFAATGFADGFYGSVRITNSANQPLAVASTQYPSNNNLMMETSNTQPPTTILYGPLIQNNNNGWTSGLVKYQVGGNSVTVSFYPKVNSLPCHEYTTSTNPWSQYPAIIGATNCSSTPLAQFTASSGTTIVANVNQLKPGVSATTYSAIANPSRQAIVGKVWRNSASTGWSDAFVIANYNSSNASVTVRFYDSNGTINSTLTYSIGTLQSVTIGSQVPTNFTGGVGSAVVSSDQPIAVMANSYYPGGDANTRDVIGSYPATHR